LIIALNGGITSPQTTANKIPSGLSVQLIITQFERELELDTNCQDINKARFEIKAGFLLRHYFLDISL